MFNLAFLFDDALESMAGHHKPPDDHANNIPLPAAVYLMQADVINLYTFAMDHYFILPLDAHCLQNSSLGSPYEKWAHFSNENFEKLAFGINNLLRYTSRLVHGPWARTVPGDGRERSSEIMSKWNQYTELIFESNHRQYGILINPDQFLFVTPVKITPSIGSLVTRSSAPGCQFIQFRDEQGQVSEDRITNEEAALLASQIRPRKIDITNRAVLQELHEEGHGEITLLTEKHVAFGEVCNEFYQSRSFTGPYRTRDFDWI